MNNIQMEKVKQMRKEGQSYSKIAEVLEINKNTIKAFCRRNNLGAIDNTQPKKEKEICTVCKHCNKPLIQGTKGQPKKFCSDECRRTWWKGNIDSINKRAYYNVICSHCGKEFKSYGNKSRKFCNHRCYINSRFRGGKSNDQGTI